MKAISLFVSVLLGMGLAANSIFAAEMSSETEWQIRAEIKKLVDDYAIYRDNFDGASYANLFIEQGRSIGPNGEEIVGRPALQNRVDSVNRNRITMHVMSSGQVDILDESHAAGVHYATVYGRTLETAPEEGEIIELEGFAILAKYIDKYELTSEGWKFSERRVQPVFTQAN